MSDRIVVGIAIPTRNEVKSLRKLLPYLDNRGYFVVISDDHSTNGSVEIGKDYGALIPYHEKKLGMGRSWKEALIFAWYSYDCDKVICMDADHNYKVIPLMLRKLEDADVVVGCELGEWTLPRKVTRFMCNVFLDLNLKHPTCGFIGFRKEVLDRMPWKHVKSKGDIFHVELLFWAKKMGADIVEQDFPTLKGVKHHYNIRRYIRWLFEFFRLLRLKYLWFFRWKEL